MNRAAALLLLLLLLAAPPLSPKQNEQAEAAARFQRKLDHLQRNAARETPDPAPTVLSEEEANAYFAEGNVKLPAGVNWVRFRSRPDSLTAVTQVDFDEVRRGRRITNPLLSVFTGVHEVEVVTQARGVAGTGIVEVETVSIDGVRIPRMVLEMFVERFITPKYPGVGMETRFEMPARIHSAVVEQGQVSLIQK